MSEIVMVSPVTAEVVPGRNGWPVQGQWRYADYLRLPDDGKRYEIINRVLYVANAPGFDHQFAVNNQRLKHVGLSLTWSYLPRSRRMAD